MKWYHRTTEEIWKKIQEEGVLWGIPNTHSNLNNPAKIDYRFTCVSRNTGNICYGEVLLEVEHSASHDSEYDCDCYTIILEPIPLSQVKRIE